MSDASGTGFGGTFLDYARGTQVEGLMGSWSPPRDMSDVVNAPLIEGRAALRWAQTFAHKCAGKRLLLEIDSATLVWALESLYSSNADLAAVVAGISAIMCRYHVVLRVRHVMGDIYNTVAHHLSHGSLAQAQCHALLRFQLPLVLVLHSSQ
jgi:hypothetical protein